MKHTSIAIIAIVATTLAGCGAIPLPRLGGSHVPPAAADSNPDGTLTAGHGKPAPARAKAASSADRQAESRGIEADAPYGVVSN